MKQSILAANILEICFSFSHFNDDQRVFGNVSGINLQKLLKPACFENSKKKKIMNS